MEIKNNDQPSSISKENNLTDSTYQETEANETSSFSFSQLGRDAAKQAAKSASWFTIVLITFSLINIVFLAFSFIGTGNPKTLYGILTFLIGLIIIPFSITSVYRYIIIDAVSVVYKYLTPFFKKICVKVINIAVDSGNKLTKRDIEQKLNVGSLMLEIYGKKAPKYVQKGLLFILGKIPFNTFLVNMQQELSEKKDNRRLSEILYKQLDDHLTNSVFGENSMKWFPWLILLNLLAQVAVIYYLR
ncbi:MAG: hypothetical protein E6772_11030 [Dysgonomonas sp.]|nr:hypothetical protein [Dysgonomonas sp.]